MKGTLILNGGEPYTARARIYDHRWLQEVRPSQGRPRVVVVPAADVSGTRREADRVMRYFNNLGTFAEYSMITSQLAANTAGEFEILDKVDVIALTDGSAIDMVERLQGTRTEAALRRALARQAIVMATGAGAMALGGVFWMGGEWEPGLGLAPQLAVLPHHEMVQMRLTPERLLSDLPEGVTVIGIEGGTYLFWRPDDSYEVVGAGLVVVYRSVEQLESYSDGATFTL